MMQEAEPGEEEEGLGLCLFTPPPPSPPPPPPTDTDPSWAEFEFEAEAEAWEFCTLSRCNRAERGWVGGSKPRAGPEAAAPRPVVKSRASTCL